MSDGVRISLRVELPGSGRGTPRFCLVARAHRPSEYGSGADVRDIWEDRSGSWGESFRREITLAVGRAAAIWFPLRRLLAADVPDRILLDPGEADQLLDSAAARLRAGGIEVEWPEDVDHSLTAWLVVGYASGPGENAGGIFNGERSLSLDWQLALDGDRLEPVEMDLIGGLADPVAVLRDRRVLVPPNMARKAARRTLRPLTAIDALGVALTGTTEVDGEQVEVEPGGWIDELKRQIDDPEGIGDGLAQPESLNTGLREYQLRGLRWLERMCSLGLGGCLADDMGLGKTVMLIAVHLTRQLEESTSGPTLVACPASLLGNWEREVARFAPSEPVCRFHGTGRNLDGVEGGFVITTYGTMRLDAEKLARIQWGLVVADEAQHVKNPSSSAAKALRRIPAKARVALTGTPIENNLTELWSILDWTTPGLLGTLGDFKQRWVAPVEVKRDEWAAAKLAKLVRPFLLRRRKSDPGIAPELPPKIETDQPVELTAEQVKLYEGAVTASMAEIRSSEGIARRGLVLKLLTGLKQICNHPAQYLGETGTPLAERSGKLDLLDELLDTILAEDQSVLVFTQYVTMARLLSAHLESRGTPSQMLYGGTPVAKREQMVDRFQAGEVSVFLLSLRAAGVGLNLTRAEHVVHYDRWWNPAVEEQATDRAHRIGQTRPVQVHRLITEGTVEDRIANLHESKRELADAIVGSGETALTDLDDDDLADLVRLRGIGNR